MHEYFYNIIIYIAIYIIAVLAFNLAVGFTGLVNLGHMVFFGIGAYASALMTLNGIPWYFAVVLSALIASALGAAVAAITVRLKGDYFQVVTIGLVFIAIAISRNWISLTRGALGLPGIPRIFSSFYYMLFVAVISGACIWFFLKLAESHTGKIFQAIRDDETAAQILGKNTYRYKVLSIAISTFFAGLAGSLFVHHVNFVDPAVFDLEYFVLILSMLIVGGLASVWGSVAGVIVLSIITELMRYIPATPEFIGAFRQMFYLTIVLLILIFRPRGIFGKGVCLDA